MLHIAGGHHGRVCFVHPFRDVALLAGVEGFFMNFAISEDEPYLTSKQNFNDLLRRVATQGGVMSPED